MYVILEIDVRSLIEMLKRRVICWNGAATSVANFAGHGVTGLAPKGLEGPFVHCCLCPTFYFKGGLCTCAPA